MTIMATAIALALAMWVLGSDNIDQTCWTALPRSARRAAHIKPHTINPSFMHIIPPTIMHMVMAKKARTSPKQRSRNECSVCTRLCTCTRNKNKQAQKASTKGKHKKQAQQASAKNKHKQQAQKAGTKNKQKNKNSKQKQK